MKNFFKYFLFFAVFIWRISILPNEGHAHPKPKRIMVKTLHTNGKIHSKGYTKLGYKHGNWYYFTQNGIIYKREYYQKDSLLRTYHYNEKGYLLQIINSSGKIVNKKACNCG